MRSDSLIRLESEGALVNGGAAAQRQHELELQKAAFFSRGGQVEQLPGFTDKQAHRTPPRDVVFDHRTSGVKSNPMRELVDGRWVVVRQRAAALAGYADVSVKAMLSTGKFPKPVLRNPNRWDEEEVIEWGKNNPNKRAKSKHQRL